MGKRKIENKAAAREGAFGRPTVESAPASCHRVGQSDCPFISGPAGGSVDLIMKLLRRFIEADQHRAHAEKTALGRALSVKRRRQFMELRKSGKTPRQIRSLAKAQNDPDLARLCDEIISRRRRESDLMSAI